MNDSLLVIMCVTKEYFTIIDVYMFTCSTFVDISCTVLFIVDFM